MQYSKQKCSIPFLISVTFLWSNAFCFCRNIPTKSEVFLQKKHHTSPLWGSAVCISKFQLSNILFRKVNILYIYIYICTICIRSINDIEHPSQKCNMLETASIIKECSFASYNRILLKKQHLENWITCVWHVYYVLFPLVSPAFIYFGLERQLSLEEMWSVLSNSNVSFESNISFISRGSRTK